MSRKSFLGALERKNQSGRAVFGTGTSIVCRDIMDFTKTWFPEGHTDPEAMFRLAIAGHTLLGFDAVMPLFSVCHEVAAMGCDVNWGGPDMMPECGKPIFNDSSDIAIPPNLLSRPACAVPIKALAMLKAALGEDAAVCGKILGGWTQSYHYFGLENFLIKTISEPDEVKKILEKLLPVTIQFAQAQIDAGADCLLLADHATRDLCGPHAYEEFLLDIHTHIQETLDVPLILHICGNTADRIGLIARTGINCFHWDTMTGRPEEVRKMAGPDMALMGGISNPRLLQGSPEEIAGMAVDSIEAKIDIIGPECAIPLKTPLSNLKSIASA